MVDPDLVENPDDKNKLKMDIDSMTGLIESGIEQGKLNKNTPVEILSHTLTDILYGEMLCWHMSGGAYSFEERTKEASLCGWYYQGGCWHYGNFWQAVQLLRQALI